MLPQKTLFSLTAFSTLLICVILSSSSYTVLGQQRHSNIRQGSSLTPTTNSSWKSPSGLFAFGFFRQGNGYSVGVVFLAGISEQTVVWTANQDDPLVTSNATLAFTNDGTLILKQPQVPDRNIITSLTQAATTASMLDSGNFVLYSFDQQIIWQSFGNPTDTILPGQRLSAGKELISSASETDHSSGLFRLKLQTDGNLVQYPVGVEDGPKYAYWASYTWAGGNNCTLNLDSDGSLYLLNETGNNIKTLASGESTKEGKIYMMRIDVDGIFRLYSRALVQNSSWSIMWNSSTDKCDPKGVCGLNGFCVAIDNIFDCRCIPGFAPVNPGNWTSGCERNFTAESCENTNGAGIMSYIMHPLENSIWEDISYSVLQMTTREECEKACLQDCNCEAALYKDSVCKKQRLPLRYGRRLLSDSSVAFIKENGVSTFPTKQSNKELRLDILIIAVILIVFALVVFAISAVLIYRNKLWAYRKISEKGNVELGDEISLRKFTFEEIEQVTNGFNEELGKGAFGTVYKGIISYNQRIVAVKRLDKLLTEGEREFQIEIKAIGRTHHRNLVRLIGYCIDGPNRLLVYEYMCNGSLADLLFQPEKQLSWDERIGIAHDIARGILYLHEECETQIIHCDIKPQNILIDEQRRAKISDFGLAKLLKPDQTKTSTGIRGTRGYVAPEWYRKIPITVKADVYSFGVVLLEIICCRKSLEPSLGDEEAILEVWVYDCFEKGELDKLVGEEEVDHRKLNKMVKVGLWCILDEPSLRPSMKKVLLMLEGTVDIPIPPNPTSFLTAM